MNSIKIIGGGLAGLIAAHYFKGAHVFEAGPRKQMHKALLRFRSDDVSNITGVPFRKVRVYKEVHYQGKTFQGKCPIALANMYAAKVTGAISGRSIMKLEECDRYIAPDNLYEVLCDRLESEGRLWFNQAIEGRNFKSVSEVKRSDVSWINTAPLPVILKLLGIEDCDLMTGFKRSPIIVARYKVKTPCDVYQTIYFPDEHSSLFRASITGDILIVESMNSFQTHNNAVSAAAAFGLSGKDIDFEAGEIVDQAYGKIMDLNAASRESILYQLTNKYNIFSLGRFATWRNILLDDVADDLPKIERLINASNYGREKILKL
ncbi:hypothetical protein CPT_MTx_077 [Serratia phage MTx]|uniref:Uncharacterized protein n=1 Tax=Serratia phage MTx TaxID=2557553 RepID=A0A482MGX1_9CAUD|nr:hypothetical protein HWC15_gp077 [Serratia phage MTx]QBQ72383.1 hypothetical protein CPT_MTx_077 [Serratia phage MTx]